MGNSRRWGEEGHRPLASRSLSGPRGIEAGWSHCTSRISELWRYVDRELPVLAKLPYALVLNSTAVTLDSTPSPRERVSVLNRGRDAEDDPKFIEEKLKDLRERFACGRGSERPPAQGEYLSSPRLDHHPSFPVGGAGRV